MPQTTTKQSRKIQAAKEKKILDAAKKLFLKKGYFNVNVAKIAREAGISKASFYNYFQGKSDVLKHLVENYFCTASRLDDKLKGREKIKTYIDNSIGMLDEHSGFLKVIYPMVFFTRSNKYLKDLLYDITIKQIRELSTAFEEAGAEHPFGEAALLVTEIDGMYLHYMTIREKYHLQLFKDILYHRYKLG